ncbi:hypothetical protein HZY83_04365 [Gemella sp. GH3]|uniref:hypothetical protein n=1 Tax=unclassified Gemella TaxID=2624949 RepID=UPI0015CFD46D|nr:MULTISPECIES: hypothetical protein [unclassified Gemella]MBF0713914.1 hypothetical protein [Gemella sp. GH3.1]NYS50866.1 hypothetical protein [Gemella sp. GH3]
MEILLLIIFPIITLIISAIVIGVYFSDSNKHKKRLNNNESARLEQLRKEVIKNINAIKSMNKTKEDLNNENINLQKNLISAINKQSQEINKFSDDLKNYRNSIASNYNKEIIVENSNIKTYNNNKLIFNKNNIVRGLITSEYIERKNNRR